MMFNCVSCWIYDKNTLKESFADVLQNKCS